VSRTAADGHLFDVVPQIRDVEDMLAGCRRLRDDLARQVSICDRSINRLDALAYALRELAGEPATAAVAARLTENGWSGSGEQLATSARAVVAQAWLS
jgi:hypothetical protein